MATQKENLANAFTEAVPEFKWLTRITDLFDNLIRIPGTRITFGLDAIIGLIPFYGELMTYGVSGFLVLGMVRNGASGKVVILMLWNIFRDAVIGLIPFFGDIYDVGHRANTRNLRLLKDHWEKGEHQGSGLPLILSVLGAIIGLFFVLVFIATYVVWKVIAALGDLIF